MSLLNKALLCSILLVFVLDSSDTLGQKLENIQHHQEHPNPVLKTRNSVLSLEPSQVSFAVKTHTRTHLHSFLEGVPPTEVRSSLLDVLHTSLFLHT